MESYLNLVRHILAHGVRKSTRTNIDTLAVVGYMFEHDMAHGFPLLRTKKMSLRLIATELEFFIKGITDKRWLQERNNHIWDEWATPSKVPYGQSAEIKQQMLEEHDLGPIYGFQWRHFGAEYDDHTTHYAEEGIDQLRLLVNTLKADPSDRRMIVSAWNPTALSKMALPPCHYAFQVLVTDGRLNLLWNQRSVDVMLGLPFNTASYALLLHLLAKETGFKEGKLIGFLADAHIYVNHLDGAHEQIGRDPNKFSFPAIETIPFDSLFSWQASDTRLIGYDCYPPIKFEIAV